MAVDGTDESPFPVEDPLSSGPIATITPPEPPRPEAGGCTVTPPIALAEPPEFAPPADAPVPDSARPPHAGNALHKTKPTNKRSEVMESLRKV
jgi:hypothetical protein